MGTRETVRTRLNSPEPPAMVGGEAAFRGENGRGLIG